MQPAVPAAGEWLRDALEAMAWVAEERGLGGARSLDGLAWDLSIDSVWEAWIVAFTRRLGGRLGMTATPFAGARRALRWVGPVQSMGSLAPDVELRSAERVVWIDAKYKPHLQLLAHRGWSGVSDEIRREHRADLHQALAYASLAFRPRGLRQACFAAFASRSASFGVEPNAEHASKSGMSAI